MKLHYWRPPARNGSAVTNFGDELNGALWPLLLGRSFFDDDDEVAFFGIGSLLGWPKSGDSTRRHRVVFGTGAAFASAATREPRDESWRVYCVRGPLTARAYGLDPALAVTDPAILIAKFHRRVDPTVRLAFMPHIDEATRWSHVVAPACAEMGVRYVDPRGGVSDVIDAVASASLLVAEAMHGAIVADALRVPWVPVYSTLRPYRFKWTDWCGSMGLEFRPRRLTNVARWADNVGVRGGRLERAAGSLFAADLGRITSNCTPMLSDDRVHALKTERLEAALGQLRADVGEGSFVTRPGEPGGGLDALG